MTLQSFLLNESNRRIGNLSLLLALLLPLTTAYAQEQRRLSGIVRDIGGPLEGVSVEVKQGVARTVTDAAGQYRIQANSGDTLVFRNVGYAMQEMIVEQSETINVLLVASTSSLDEVVVVGYGTQSRRNVTGSVSKVDMSETENLPNSNITQALRGRVAGVQFTDNGRPGQNGSILVRGPRSLSASNNPLIILDGMFFNGSFIDINPNDIESIEVLKDASAAAIYGSRAANGVILVTSKRGTTEKPTITINSFYGLSDWAARMRLLSPDQYIQMGMDVRDHRNIPYDPNDPATFLALNEAENYLNGHVTDPFDKVSQQGRIYSTDISMAGNSKHTNYYLSTALSGENGLIYDDNIRRISLRANLENKITDWLTIGTNTMFSENDQSGVPANLSLASRQSPFGTWDRDDGTPTQFLIPEFPGVSQNPLRNSFLSDSEDVRSNLFANFYTLIDVPRIEGLTFRVNYSTNYRWIKDYNATRNDVHLPDENISSASKRNWKAYDWVLENILDYKFRLNDHHVFDVTLMYGANKDSHETTTASSSLLEYDIFGWHKLDIGGVMTNTSFAQEVAGVSSMARINYRLKDKYLVTLTARRDGSSVFAANNKYATLPSAAFAWVLSDESFMDDVRFVDFLKVRTSYGAVGNQAISPYQSISIANINRYVYGSQTAIGLFPTNIANEDLKWETTYTSNIALDFELFSNRIGGTIELYDMDTRDLLVERSIPTMTGYSSVWTNLGRVNNRGIELTLNTVNIRKERFEWSSNFVFSNNRNKIVSLYGIDTDGSGQEDDDIGNSWFIGHPINVYYDFVFDGIYQIGDEIPEGFQPGFPKFQDLNSDGELDADYDRTIIGQGGQPRFRWGITNNFRYRNFDLSIFINAMQGWIGTFNDMDYYSNGRNPISSTNLVYAGDWWTPENPSNTRPSLEYTRTWVGHSWYLSRNFIRVQDVSLSYSFPSSFLQKNKLSNLGVFLSGKNLWTFTDWLGTNPESISSDRYPIPRSYTMGFRLGF